MILTLAWLVVSLVELAVMGAEQPEGGLTTNAVASSDSAVAFAAFAGVVALVFALQLAKDVMKQPAGNAKMQEIALAIQEGSRAFLQREYTWLAVFVSVTAVVQVAAIGFATAACFVAGAVLSGACGYMGMSIAVRGNVRTAAAAAHGLDPALRIAFNTVRVHGSHVHTSTRPHVHSLILTSTTLSSPAPRHPCLTTV